MAYKQISEIIDEYNALAEYANREEKDSVSYDWIMDVVHHMPAHCVGLSPDDPLLYTSLSASEYFVRLDDDIEGVGVLQLRRRIDTDEFHTYFNTFFYWEVVNLMDSENEGLRAMMAKMFETSIPEHYDSNLNIIKPFETR